MSKQDYRPIVKQISPTNWIAAVECKQYNGFDEIDPRMHYVREYPREELSPPRVFVSRADAAQAAKRTAEELEVVDHYSRTTWENA